jgi:hypothetical protein
MKRMRSPLGAAVVLVVAAMLAAPSLAGDRAPPTPTAIAPLLAKLQKNAEEKPRVAALRFLREVLAVEFAESYGEPTPDSLAEQAEGLLASRGFAPLTLEKREVAAALLVEYGEAMPPSVRGFILAQQGKDAAAVAALTSFVEALVPKTCPGEHPDAGSARVRRVDFALKTLTKFAPKVDRAALNAKRSAAMNCVTLNNAVG